MREQAERKSPNTVFLILYFLLEGVRSRKYAHDRVLYSPVLEVILHMRFYSDLLTALTDVCVEQNCTVINLPMLKLWPSIVGDLDKEQCSTMDVVYLPCFYHLMYLSLSGFVTLIFPAVEQPIARLFGVSDPSGSRTQKLPPLQ